MNLIIRIKINLLEPACRHTLLQYMVVTPTGVFRWFKFTLKPPYSIAIGKLRLAIWDTSFWTFLLKFGHKGP